MLASQELFKRFKTTHKK